MRPVSVGELIFSENFKISFFEQIHATLDKSALCRYRDDELFEWSLLAGSEQAVMGSQE